MTSSRPRGAPRGGRLLGGAGLSFTWLLTALLVALLGGALLGSSLGACTSDAPTVVRGDEVFAQAFSDRAEELLVEGRGLVSRLLADDAEGSRHQRFIVRLDSGQTLLIVHNIDVAPRVDSVKVGDTVEFRGRYVWNEQGGLVHWTHHDPGSGRQVGWIRHDGRLYE